MESSLSGLTLLKNMTFACIAATLSGPVAAQQYTALNGPVKDIEAPWIFDGRQVSKGLVAHIAEANTAENRHACATEWKNVVSYRSLCNNLSDLKIVTVRLTDLNNHSVTRVPVSRIAKIANGDEVLIRMADLAQDNAVRSLPVFMRVLSKNRQAGQQSLLDAWRKLI
jgi:hypothetical protein